MSPWIEHEPLRGDHVTLEPLTADHVDELVAAADDEALFRWTSAPIRTRNDAAAYIDAALTDPARQPFLQRTAAGDPVGTTSYYLIDPAHRSLAIGYTWLSTSAQGTAINPEAKLLLLDRAFAHGAVRVEWHTDDHNVQSRAAIAALGATFEGLLRKHRQRTDGSWRTTALFSMTDDDWPSARQALRARIDGRRSGGHRGERGPSRSHGGA
ncbi:GNAT family N-acetyltransferase [Rhodococcoides corynebacterioides]|uniref:GNAT family N-acetyltransferase n=1 Tax=Rhodococcoides corynebacterioides TaxID=53972 RepID=UPI001C9A8811|nr:GNAT family protein [Rhodococcus corynebacterioides]MBY6352117.1 GNAT family N-acetyltransferase [Rhodococcus corynebacterioides]